MFGFLLLIRSTVTQSWTEHVACQKARLQSSRRMKFFLKTANKDLITNDRKITTHRWRLYENSELADDAMKNVLPEDEPHRVNALRRYR